VYVVVLTLTEPVLIYSQIKRSNINNRKLKLFWNFRNAPEKLLFPSLLMRERFYELVWAAKYVGLGLATFTDNPRCPVQPLQVLAESMRHC
jgi:hypothetical protein